MSTAIEHELKIRSNSCCELCGSSNNIQTFKVEPSILSFSNLIVVCDECKNQIEDESKLDVNHWHCLNETIWSDIPAVQVVAYRVLKKIDSHEWTKDLLDMLYLEEDVLSWAESSN